jgi:hypothetical protein
MQNPNNHNQQDAEPSSHRLRFSSELETYKFHMEAAIKVALTTFTITGAIISYTLSTATASPITKHSLLLPIILNIGVAITYRLSIRRTIVSYEKHKATCEILQIEDFDMTPLSNVCTVLFWSFLLVCIGMIVLYSVLISTKNT